MEMPNELELSESSSAPVIKQAKAKMEYAIYDLGQDLSHKTKKLYIGRTWETEFEAEGNRLSLLKGFPQSNPWVARLIVAPHKKIPLGSNKRTESVIDPIKD